MTGMIGIDGINLGLNRGCLWEGSDAGLDGRGGHGDGWMD